MIPAPFAGTAGAIAIADLAGQRPSAADPTRTIAATNSGAVAAATQATLTGPVAANARPIAAADPAGPISATADLTRKRRHAAGAGRTISAADPAGAVTAANLTGKRRGSTRAEGTVTASADLAGERRGSARAVAATEPTRTSAPQAAGAASPWPRAADLAGAERRSGPIGKAATRTARRATAKLAGKRRRAAEPARAPTELARQSGSAPAETTGAIPAAKIPRLRRGSREAPEISGLR